MTSIRIRIDRKIIKKLREQHERQIISEFGIVPNDSVIVTMALIELEAMKCNQEADIKIKKNGKVTYAFK